MTVYRTLNQDRDKELTNRIKSVENLITLEYLNVSEKFRLQVEKAFFIC